MKTTHRSSLSLAAVLVLAAPLAAQAQSHLTPGLWEQSVTTKSQSGEMESAMAKAQAAMASMTPEQRKMMEGMMASKGVGIGAKANTLRMCLTKEQAERDFVSHGDGNCKNEIISRSGNTLRYKFSCANNPPTTGEGEFTMTSPTAYTGTSTVNMTMHGKPDVMQSTVTGKWLGADCGSIKPMTPPAAR